MVIRSLVLTLTANYPELGRERIRTLVAEVAGDTEKFFSKFIEEAGTR